MPLFEDPPHDPLPPTPPTRVCPHCATQARTGGDTKHARELVADGLLDGPILRSTCDPVGGGRDDLEARTGKYECMAVSEERPDGSLRGYTYDATINYVKYSYSWKLGG